ncbi:NAD(P)H-binding protein [Diaminobutyricibacter tongyongensis]|uniref:NAD(P)H-binding protein n=1 Tax=Leifsonia tongyongensis TaxID=1268043 RepID=A0A6L9XZ13_9MICO|nr:NAD(P)H-binding protein [Diaminobutyricibacter tongyongensis]NEN06661.1 NAD(P)H-binding protein [Diaminobutyricibacter tongyongensis]
MARVLVVGGTGLAGRAIVAEAVGRGHDVVVASRRVPDDDNPSYVPGAVYTTADLVTADGLEEAVDGMDVLIDASNGAGREAGHTFTIGSQNLLHTAARFGVGHAVLLSIVNVDRSGYSYYRAKAAQERTYHDSPIETRIVRTTQFHDFIASLFAAGARAGIIPAFSKVRFQTIAVSDVATILVDAAEGNGPSNSTRAVGGPRIQSSRALAEAWKQATGSRAVIAGIRQPGALGAAWRAGDNLAPDQAIDGLDFERWLSSTV